LKAFHVVVPFLPHERVGDMATGVAVLIEAVLRLRMHSKNDGIVVVALRAGMTAGVAEATSTSTWPAYAIGRQLGKLRQTGGAAAT
jgi:hypothetical protein